MVKSVPDYFASMVFNERVMQERLPKQTYKMMRQVIETGRRLERDVADIVANAMKDWAVEKGATHFTHWFQPMTGITAEKHDSFIMPVEGGSIIMEFSGKELIQGEPDASSFPNGGLRATFEARGYTAWDPTSFAFIKDDTLCIPTAFYSYGGQALDKKTPLLRSMEVLNKQALRILRLFGDTEVLRVNATVGAEQEYFIIDKEMFKKRKDLLYCGRTLFGAKSPKGQELDDHYFGAIKDRVKAFMADLNDALWKLGVLAKTEHNEVAPAQHEMASVFETVNISCDHNQVTMEVMKRIAERHGLACLLHEKPFAGINGSGKHNNWSLSTDKGVNLLEPGDSPMENVKFLTFLTALIKAVDDYQDLLRISVASAGNDHRLGGNEAPPAIISMFIGEELETIIDSIERGIECGGKGREVMKVGVQVLPRFFKDTTDRNRTSPFAFTGNKFEFRMLGSAVSIACPNFILNTIVAEALSQFAEELEEADDFDAALHALIRRTIKKHKRIIFNGNNYAEEWVAEAEERGLLNLKSTADALPYYLEEKNISLFERHRILSREEVESRYEILMENYVKTIRIEALTMLDMAKKNILPAVIGYVKNLAEGAALKQSISVELDSYAETVAVKKISAMCHQLVESIDALERTLNFAANISELRVEGEYCRDVVLLQMDMLRSIADEMETEVDEAAWPFPTYGDLLFSAN